MPNLFFFKVFKEIDLLSSFPFEVGIYIFYGIYYCHFTSYFFLLPVTALPNIRELEKGMAIRSVFLLGEFHGQRSQAGCSPQGRTELDTAEAT